MGSSNLDTLFEEKLRPSHTAPMPNCYYSVQ